MKLTKEEYDTIEERFRTDFRYEYLNTIEEILEKPIDEVPRNEYLELLNNKNKLELINKKLQKVKKKLTFYYYFLIVLILCSLSLFLVVRLQKTS